MVSVVGIVVFDDVEVLDACGPFEAFSVANRVAGRGRPGSAPFDVVTISAGSSREIAARGGLRLTADHTLADAPTCDVVVMPGGVVDAVRRDEPLLSWLTTARDDAEVMASVCNGAFVMAEAGLLRGRVTTHWEDAPALREAFPALEVVDDERFVDHGDVATSAGVSAGIDLSLHLVARYAGTELAVATARQMDYPWDPDAGELVPPTAGEGLF
jgi:transcriptional regulator GlxA family with amidase domain